MIQNNSKGKLELLLQVITRYTEQMVTVAENLKKVAELQEKANARLFNGMSKEISNAVTEAVKEYNTARENDYREIRHTLEEINIKASNMGPLIKDVTKEALDDSSLSKDINVSKWLIGIIAALVVVVVAVVRVIDNRHPNPIHQRILTSTQEIIGK